MFERMGVMFLL